MDYTGLEQKIREVHRFPCLYTFKIIGAARVLEEANIREVVGSACPGAIFTLTCRTGATDRWRSWTLDVQAPDVETVITLYTHLEKLNGLKVLL